MKLFTKLSHQDQELPDDAPAADVAGIRINAVGVIVAPLMLNDGKPCTYAEACELADKLDFGGHKWRAPTIEELFLIPDRSKFDPALDPAHFQFLIDAVHANDKWWIWSSTASAAYPGDHAWYVYLNHGISDVGDQSYRGLALAVRGPVASAGQ